MSLRDSLATLLVAGLFCALPGLAAAQDAKAAAVTCPATITAAGSAHSFERISVYNGTPGGQEYELAPDESSGQRGNITQKWILSGYRSMKIFLRCRYSGTKVVRTRDLPSPIQSCTFRFNMDNKGKITGKSEVECR